MLQVARLAPTLLGDSRELVTAFLHRSVNADGGFPDRSGQSDLYYTVFGLDGLLALGQDVPRPIASFLEGFGDGRDLDFVHLACLAHAWAASSRTGPPLRVRAAVIDRLNTFRSDDGGFAASEGAAIGTAYACFLALDAFEDLAEGVPEAPAMLRCLDGLRAADGGYANHAGAELGSTPATAAAVVLMRHLDRAPDERVVSWLLARSHQDGGFVAAPNVPMPDLLSTATALHALAALHADLEPLRENCLNFLDTLWTGAGGFYGSWADSQLDCEYTYYGLLALGHLSL